jgi:nucleoside-diphosphate-sugar epimerase
MGSASWQDGAYSLSKRLAEEKAWELCRTHGSYELVTINPALVIGPTLSDRNTASYDFLHAVLGTGAGGLFTPAR